ncbi:phage tail protein, partial [Citrobacter freundii]
RKKRRIVSDTYEGDIRNVGLVETVNLAAGALQKEQNLNDVPDKAKARKALQLGSAATLDATTAVNDCTPGRVLKVGDFGLGAQTFGVIPDSHPVSERAAYGVNFSRVFRSTDSPRMDTYFNLLMMPETLNGTFAALAMSENTTPCYRAYGVGSNKSIQWAKIYDELNKPTATDVGALPITGGNLRGALRFLSPDARPNTNCMIANDDASGILACQYGYYQDRFDIHFYDEKGAWESNPVSIGRNGNTTVLGNLSGRAVYEGNTRVYSPNNPPPAPNLSGYATQQWVLQNFVQNIDLTAPAEVGFWDGRGYPRGTDGAAMYNFNMVGGSSNVGNFIVRYTRKQVNNTWYVIN